MESRGLQYARHTREGVEPVASHESSWRIRWTAPAEAPVPVIFHVAANAANYDDSEFGDVVLTAEGSSAPSDP